MYFKLAVTLTCDHFLPSRSAHLCIFMFLQSRIDVLRFVTSNQHKLAGLATQDVQVAAAANRYVQTQHNHARAHKEVEVAAGKYTHVRTHLHICTQKCPHKGIHHVQARALTSKLPCERVRPPSRVRTGKKTRHLAIA